MKFFRLSMINARVVDIAIYARYADEVSGNPHRF